MIENNLPILQVIIPLLFSVICCLLKSHRLAWSLSFFVVSSSFLVSIALLFKTYSGDTIVYNLGGWIAPYGVEIKIDLLNATVLTLINFIAAMSLLYGFYTNEREISLCKIPNFYAVFLLCLGGLNGLLVTNDAFNIYVFLEISSISSYVLVAMGGNRSSLVAGFEYLIIGTIGATFYLIGLGFLYAITGTLNISDLAIQIQNLHSNKTIQVGGLFIIIGLSIKMALFPFHSWLIKIYSQSPSFISVFFSGTTTKVMIYLIIRMIYSVFGTEFTFITFPFSALFITLASCAIIFSSISAILSNNIKKMFAYSSVSQIGYIVLAIGINSQLGLAAAIIHMINHSVIKSGLFMASGCIFYRFGSTDLDDFAGLGKIMPYIAILFVILSLSLIGIPITAGFVTKWYMLEAIFKSHAWGLAVILLIGSLLAVIYMWKIIEIMYFKEINTDLTTEVLSTKTPMLMVICVCTMAVITIISGIYFLPITSVAEKIAAFISVGMMQKII